MNLIYFAHSTSTDNEAHVRSGWGDPSLSATGSAQARALGEHCAQLAVVAVFCSDLKRAVETTRLAFAGREFVVDARLREMNYGVLNGCQDREFPADEYQCINLRYEAGENCLDVEARVRSFLEERGRQFKGQRVAVVSHKYPQLALDVICNGVTWNHAIRHDWRRGGPWQPGWNYVVQG